jgi:hypothetical protein
MSIYKVGNNRKMKNFCAKNQYWQAEKNGNASKNGCFKQSLIAGSYVDVPNSNNQAARMALFKSARLPQRRPGFDSRPGHVSLWTSSLG